LGCASGALLHAGSANDNERIRKAVVGANRERAPRMGPPMERESIAQCTRRPHTPRPMTRPCRLVLVGMMGSGKTSVGRLLAKRTGWPYADNDELLLQLVGKTPRELLSQDGEAALRESESAALRMGLAMPEPSIVSAAGGTILDPENRRDLQAAGLAVWLKAGPAAIQQRATGAPHRAWLDTGGLEWIRDAVAERDPLYASVADLTIEVDRRSSRQVARDVLTWLPTADTCHAFLPAVDQP